MPAAPGLDHHAVRGKPVGETPIEGVGVDASALVLNHKLSGCGVVAEQTQYQRPRSSPNCSNARSTLVVITPPKSISTAVRVVGAASAGPRAVSTVAHVCSYLSLKGLLATVR